MRFRQPDQPASTDDRPALEAVLEHYGSQLTGRNHGMTHCPMHEDRTPSLSYHLDKGVWNCHSCGEGGDSYALLMKKEGCDFGRARQLATELGLAAGGAGSSGRQLPEGAGRFGRSSRMAEGQRDRPQGGGYRPAWRRS